MSVLQPYLDDTNSLIDMYTMMDPKRNRIIDLPRRIGFDRVVVSLEVMGIDWDMFDMILEYEGKRKHKTLYATDCRNKEKILHVCDDMDKEHWYSSIRIVLGSNKFTLQKCNLPGRHDICRFEICIPPMPDHEILGNIHNLTCEQEQQRVRVMMDEIERYGIRLDKDVANIKEVEINVNICLSAFNMDFRDAVENIRQYRQCLKGFADEDHSEPDKGKNQVFYDPANLWSREVDIPARKETSFHSKSPTRIIKVYDKSAEVIEKSKGKLTFVSPITRIEFVLIDPSEIPVYFNGKNNLMHMTQDDIEDAFHSLADRLLKKPLDTYYRSVNNILEKYFGQIDIEGFAWRKNVVMDIERFLGKSNGFLIIPIEELSRYVSLIPAKSIKKNRARITKSLRAEFTPSSCIRITKSDTYTELMNWLCTIKGEEPQNIVYCIRK